MQTVYVGMVAVRSGGNMITAKMNNDKYIELSPGWSYEVEWYDSGKVKLKDFPRIYPASDLQILRNGVPITEEEPKPRRYHV